MLHAAEPEDFRWGDYRRYTFSLGVRHGDELVLSGQTASTFDTERKEMILPKELAQQAQVVYDKIHAVLAGEGFTPADVVEVTEHLASDIASRFPEVESVRRDRLPGSELSVRSVSVDRLLRPDALIEIAVRAKRGPVDGPKADTSKWLTIFPQRSVTGSPEAQVREVMDLAESRLRELHADWSNVAFAVEHVAWPALERAPSVLDRADVIGMGRIAGARVGVKQLLKANALVQLDLKVAAGPVEAIRHRDTPGGLAALAAATRADGKIYLSGQHGDHATHGMEVAGEVESAYTRLLDVLKFAGGDAKSLVETIEHVTHSGLSGYAATADVRRSLLPVPFSAATGTVCSSVGGTGRFVLYGTGLSI